MPILVVDTSVFLSDPKALERLKDSDVVIPMAVLVELEAKRHHTELGFAARNILRALEAYRQEYGNLSQAIPTGKGSVRIELHENSATDFEVVTNDDKILAVAANLQESGEKVKLLTKDLPLRLRASLFDITAEEYLSDKFTSELPEVITLDVTDDDVDYIYENDIIEVEDAEEYPLNNGFILKGPTGSALAVLKEHGLQRVSNTSIFDVNGRSAEQRIAMDLLMDRDVPIVSLSGRSGSGKSLLALAAGLESVLEQNIYKRIIVFRPLYAVGGQDLGYLPGSAEEKMEPWAAAVYDTLGSFCGDNVVDEIRRRNLVEVLPLTHIRGRTLDDSFVIIDEAQQLEKMVLLTALTRLGQNSKVVLTYDINQRDNLKVGKYDGVAAVSNLLCGNKLFGHVTLNRSERSEVAELVSSLVEG